LRSLVSKLNTFKTTPPNGLALFCGFAGDSEGKQKKISAALEPWSPISSGLYKCDSRFHTEILRDQLNDQTTFGFIVIDGHSASFHTLTGDNRQSLFKLDVDLPKKHGRGGQSKNRFARIREEKRGWYTSKIAALVVQYFIDPATSLPLVQGLVIAGLANLKDDVHKKLDPRLSKIVVGVVDVQYGGDCGFHQAITLTQGNLSDLKIVQEQQILSRFFEEIARDGTYCFGIEDTMYALTSGLVETLILWKDLSHIRCEMTRGEEKKVVFYSPDLKPEESDWTIVSCDPLLDWILDHFKEYGASIQLFSDQTSIGSQFVKGFGGLGGFLRYGADLPSVTVEPEEEDEYVW